MTAPTPARECVERVARAWMYEKTHTHTGYKCTLSLDRIGHAVGNGWTETPLYALTAMQPEIDAAVLAERERCAKVAENCSFGWDIAEWLIATKKEVSARTCHEVAAAIRVLKLPDHVGGLDEMR